MSGNYGIFTEKKITLTGEIQDVLPSKRTLEFLIGSNEKPVFIKVSAFVVNPKSLKEILYKRIPLKVIMTRAGSGQPILRQVEK